MQLSARAGRIGESATLGVSRKARELRERGVDVIDLSAGEPDFPSPRCAVEAAREALSNGFTKYTAAAGTPELRSALAERYSKVYGSPWTPDQVFVGIGGKAVLFELALALFESGDEVVIPSPFWVSFTEQVRFCGAEPVLVPTSPEEAFEIRSEPILDALSPRTKAVILNSPCNPTGGVIHADHLRRIVEGAADHGVIVISDETYEHFLYDGLPHSSVASLASEFPETVVLVGSFSKTYSMTGWRLGFGIGPPRVVGAALNIQSHATSNATSFAMVGALAALLEAEAEVEAMIEEYAARRDLVGRLLAAMPGVGCVPPAGAFYAFPKVDGFYRDGLADSVEFSGFLLDEARVAVVPGVAFGDDAHIRISFACSRETIEEGLGRIAGALAGL